MKVTRSIVEIDEEKCNGCGQCVRDCAEGAISLVDGKAKVLADFLCDGLGACLAGCPQDALRIVEREADPFDAEAVVQYMQATYSTSDEADHQHAQSNTPTTHSQRAGQAATAAFAPQETLACGCSSSLARSYAAPAATTSATQAGDSATTALSQQRHWPVKLRLVPPTAPFLRNADIVIAADCAATASPDFHRWAAGKVVLIACPKFEDPQTISSKVAAIVAHNTPQSLTVLRMEVPCCSGLVGMCQQGATEAGGNVAVGSVTMACNGEIGNFLG